MEARSTPPEVAGEFDALVLRRWAIDDVCALQDAVESSLQHLRPWMPWIEQEPASPAQRRERVSGWVQQWEAGGDYMFGLFDATSAVGVFGLHRRLGPAGLELGYWIRASHTARGLATRAASLLTATALALRGVEFVEIHHDRANLASGRVPAKLGYEFLGEFPDEPEAPAETGVECRWRASEASWRDPLALT